MFAQGTSRCCGRSLRHDIRPPLPRHEGGSKLLCRVANLLSVGQVPEAIPEAIRLGRMTALSKPDGREGSAELSLEMCGKDDREASHREGRSSHSSLPVRPVHQSRV